MKKTLALTAAAFLLIVSLAYAAGITRKEYVARVDPICKAYEMKSVQPWTNSEKRQLSAIRRLARERAQEGRNLKVLYIKLKAVPQPKADAARLTRWLDYLRSGALLLDGISRAIRAGYPHSYRRLEAQIKHVATLANKAVSRFDFAYC
jgi:hypothetical protein